MIIIGLNEKLYPSTFVHINSIHDITALDAKANALEAKRRGIKGEGYIEGGGYIQGGDIKEQGNIKEGDMADDITVRSISTYKKHIVWFHAWEDRDFMLCDYCKAHTITFSVCVRDMVEFLSCAYFTPLYIMLKHDAHSYQELANTYVLDSKILAIINDIEQITHYARLGIDGVVFEECLNNA